MRFGEFAGPLQDRYGWNQTELNLSLTFAFIFGILARVIEIWTVHFGVRPVMFISLVLIAIGFARRPLITEFWHRYTLSAIVYAGFPGVPEITTSTPRYGAEQPSTTMPPVL